MATVLITGGTGLIGTALTKALVQKGYEVIILSRSKKSSPQKNISYAVWDVNNQTIDEEAVKRADYIVHLAGANVGEKRWTGKRKKEIVDSRVDSGRLLVNALSEIPNKVKAVISSSAMGYYGPDTETPNPKPFVETAPPHNDFLATTVVQWEAAIEPVKNLGKRLVLFRTGIVLSNEGGAYKEFKKPLQFGLASILGSGKQIVSWIHIDDLIRLYIEAIENEKYNGVYNAVAPNPVSNKDLIKEIATQTKKFHITAKVPAFALKIILGEMSIEVLKSTTVSSEKVQQEGFQFLYPTIRDAVASLSI
ncbi:MAG TPA: TIGR01777 family oxidoreductase [Flavisolibacter sp.]|nr:TIGR01777 family oxidoreductase [Flavisolibacter sp.]